MGKVNVKDLAKMDADVALENAARSFWRVRYPEDQRTRYRSEPPGNLRWWASTRRRDLVCFAL